MCKKATCTTCKKATWWGCGNHVPSVMDPVPETEWCTCTEGRVRKSKPAGTAGQAGSVKEYPPMGKVPD